MSQHIEAAQESIQGFSLDEAGYTRVTAFEDFRIIGNGAVFMKPGAEAKAKIHFGKTEGCKVFIGRNFTGVVNITFKAGNSLVYIGDDCRLGDVTIRSFQTDDFIAIGNGVTTTASCTWISGNGAGAAKPAIIIGDDCMFAYDIVIRSSDAHPIFDMETDRQVNEPAGIVHIEPHVWICEGASILKSVRVGACSIIGLGSVVTKDIPRFSVANGVPATIRPRPGKFWARSLHQKDKNRARHFADKYKS